jgi:ankyrin repeat protein
MFLLEKIGNIIHNTLDMSAIGSTLHIISVPPSIEAVDTVDAKVRRMANEIGKRPENFRAHFINRVSYDLTQKELSLGIWKINELAGANLFGDAFQKVSIEEVLVSRFIQGKRILTLLRDQVPCLKKKIINRKFFFESNQRMAALMGYKKLLAQLLCDNTVPSEPKSTLITCAIIGSHTQWVGELLNNETIGDGVDLLVPPPIIVAVLMEHYDLIQPLKEAGFDLNAVYQGCTPVQHVISNKAVGQFNAMIALGAKLNVDLGISRISVAHWAIEQGYSSFLKALVSHPENCDRQARGEYFVHALSYGNIACVKALHQDLDLPTLDSGGLNVWTRIASAKVLSDTVCDYLARFVNINAQDSMGRTVLDAITASGRIDDLMLFSRKGANTLSTFLAHRDQTLRNVVGSQCDPSILRFYVELAKNDDIITSGEILSVTHKYTDLETFTYLASKIIWDDKDQMITIFDSVNNTVVRKVVLPIATQAYFDSNKTLPIDWAGLLKSAIMDNDVHFVYSMCKSGICAVQEVSDDRAVFSVNGVIISTYEIEQEFDRKYCFKSYGEFSTIDRYFGSMDRAVKILSAYPTSCGRAIKNPHVAEIIQNIESRELYFCAASNLLTKGDLIAVQEKDVNNPSLVRLFRGAEFHEISKKHAENCPQPPKIDIDQANLEPLACLREFADHVHFETEDQKLATGKGITRFLDFAENRKPFTGMPNQESAPEEFALWYDILQTRARAVFTEVKKRADPETISSIYLDFAHAGGYCGTEWMNTVEYWWDLLFAPKLMTFTDLFLKQLAKKRKGVVDLIAQDLSKHYQEGLTAGYQAHLPNAVAKFLLDEIGIACRSAIFSDSSFGLDIDEKLEVEHKFECKYSSIEEFAKEVRSLDRDALDAWMRENIPAEFSTKEHREKSLSLLPVKKNNQDALLALGVRIMRDERAEDAVARVTFAEYLLKNREHGLWSEGETPLEFEKKLYNHSHGMQIRIRFTETVKTAEYRYRVGSWLMEWTTNSPREAVGNLLPFVPKDYKPEIYDMDHSDLDRLPKESSFVTQNRVRVQEYLEDIKTGNLPVSQDLLALISQKDLAKVEQQVMDADRACFAKYIEEVRRGIVPMSPLITINALKFCSENTTEPFQERIRSAALPDPTKFLERADLYPLPHETIERALERERVDAYFEHILDDKREIKLNGILNIALQIGFYETKFDLPPFDVKEEVVVAQVVQALKDCESGVIDHQALEDYLEPMEESE